jgi:flagellar protein FlaJ
MKFGAREFTIVCVASGGIMFLFANIYLRENAEIYSMANFMAALIALGIPLILRYQKMKEVHDIEAKFPDFLKGIASNIETGMTLTQAIRTLSKSDYGPLTPHIRDMAAKLDWGINFEVVLEKFADSVGSVSIKRSVKTINETHRSGGYIGTVLEAVADSQGIIERIKKEKSSSIYAQMVNGYVIFIVFLITMYGLSKFLVPAFQYQQGSGEMAILYKTIFMHLIIIQGLFAGISIGKMAEGSVFAGVKHAVVMISVGYVVFTLF